MEEGPRGSTPMGPYLPSSGSIDRLKEPRPDAFAGKQFRIKESPNGREWRQPSRVFLRRDEVSLPMLGDQLRSYFFHHLFKAGRRPIADGRPLIDVHVDAATRF